MSNAAVEPASAFADLAGAIHLAMCDNRDHGLRGPCVTAARAALVALDQVRPAPFAALGATARTIVEKLRDSRRSVTDAEVAALGQIADVLTARVRPLPERELALANAVTAFTALKANVANLRSVAALRHRDIDRIPFEPMSIEPIFVLKLLDLYDAAAGALPTTVDETAQTG